MLHYIYYHASISGPFHWLITSDTEHGGTTNPSYISANFDHIAITGRASMQSRKCRSIYGGPETPILWARSPVNFEYCESVLTISTMATNNRYQDYSSVTCRDLRYKMLRFSPVWNMTCVRSVNDFLGSYLGIFPRCCVSGLLTNLTFRQ